MGAAEEQVKASIKLAFDLAELYAKPRTEQRLRLQPRKPLAAGARDMFPYELTEDQQKSVAQIEADMESSRNMDRLLCGDVGYGKTEVALRAAFKAVVEGKRVAFWRPPPSLCSSTSTPSKSALPVSR